MTKYIFLQRLEQLLADLPEEERREALEYYQDYLDDAGITEDEDVTAKIGTPQQAADNIRAGLDQNEQQKTEIPVGEANVEDEVVQRKAGTNDRNQTYENDGTAYTQQQTNETGKEVRLVRRHSLIGTIGIGILMAFVIFLVVVVMISVAAALIGTMVGMGGGTVICFGVAIAFAGSGHLAAVAACIGAGLVLLALFLLLLAAVIAFCGKAFPKAMRAICNATSNMIYEQRRERV